MCCLFCYHMNFFREEDWEFLTFVFQESWEVPDTQSMLNNANWIEWKVYLRDEGPWSWEELGTLETKWWKAVHVDAEEQGKLAENC